MEIPLYFLSNSEIKDLKHIIDIYRYISKNPTDLIDYNTETNILKKLNKRIYIQNNELITLASLITVTVVGSEIISCGFDLDTIKSKTLLIKLISTHKEQLDDDDYVNNRQLFYCIYKTIKSSIDKLNLNQHEQNMYYILELLYI